MLSALAGCASVKPAAKPEAGGWTQDEVADSWVFGYPLVLMETARRDEVGDGPGQARVNALRYARSLPAAGAGNPLRPDVDTLSADGWLDLADEPVVVSLPASRGRYVDARALDMWTNVVWSSTEAGEARVSGLKAQTIAFVAPGWQGDLPRGVTRVDVPAHELWFSVRIQTSGAPRDLALVHRLQHAVRVAPLSAYKDRTAAVPAGPAGDGALPPDTPAARVAALDANGFFGRLADALRENPPSPDDPHALKILADFGVQPGQPVKLPDGAADGIAAGVEAGRASLDALPQNLLSANGWSWVGDGAGDYGQDYVLRAWVAAHEPGLGKSGDEVVASAARDADGGVLNGANRYRLHFARNQLPPARGFWTLTAYTKDGALGDGRYARLAFGAHGLRRNRDGSVDVIVAATRGRAANWVEVPKGDFQLVLRLYEPRPEATNGNWAPPAVVLQ